MTSILHSTASQFVGALEKQGLTSFLANRATGDWKTARAMTLAAVRSDFFPSIFNVLIEPNEEGWKEEVILDKTPPERDVTFDWRKISEEKRKRFLLNEKTSSGLYDVSPGLIVIFTEGSFSCSRKDFEDQKRTARSLFDSENIVVHNALMTYMALKTLRFRHIPMPVGLTVRTSSWIDGMYLNILVADDHFHIYPYPDQKLRDLTIFPMEKIQ